MQPAEPSWAFQSFSGLLMPISGSTQQMFWFLKNLSVGVMCQARMTVFHDFSNTTKRVENTE